LISMTYGIFPGFYQDYAESSFSPSHAAEVSFPLQERLFLPVILRTTFVKSSGKDVAPSAS